MDSDVLFRSIVGYSLATFSTLLIIVVVGRAVYLILQNVFCMNKSCILDMKKFPSFLKSTWLKIKDYVITVCCACGIIAFIVFMLYDCFGSHSQKHYDQEKIENIIDDPQWNVPGRYRG